MKLLRAFEQCDEMILCQRLSATILKQFIHTTLNNIDTVIVNTYMNNIIRHYFRNISTTFIVTIKLTISYIVRKLIAAVPKTWKDKTKVGDLSWCENVIIT